MPPPMKMLPASARPHRKFHELIRNRATAALTTAGRKEITTVGQSYKTGTGKLKLSIPV